MLLKGDIRDGQKVLVDLGVDGTLKFKPLPASNHRVTENTEKTNFNIFCFLCVLCDSVVSHFSADIHDHYINLVRTLARNSRSSSD